jgi:hypothetical protein
MSNVTNEILDQELATVIELTDNELDGVNGGWGGFQQQQNNSTAFAVSTIAFSQNNNQCNPCCF